MTAPPPTDLGATVARALRTVATRGESREPAGVVLAVSGGCDSMVLLHAAAAASRDAIRAVATFDHATGPQATAAAEFVEATGRALGFHVLRAQAERAGRTEAEWRDARWRFLRACAAEVGAVAVATAHTRDDQYETVVLRAMRGSAARGLAALGAEPAAVVRPLVTTSRAAVTAYAAEHGVAWHDDPCNGDCRHARVRVRRDLLPAVARRAPETCARVLALAASAAAHRAAVDRWVARLCIDAPAGLTDVRDGDGMNESLRSGSRAVLAVPLTALAHCDSETLALFWPAFAGHAGVRLDRRAVERLVAYTPRALTRVRTGIAQPAQISVAGRSAAGAHVVALEYARDRAGHGGAWQFTMHCVRPGGRCARGEFGGSWHGGPPVV